MTPEEARAEAHKIAMESGCEFFGEDRRDSLPSSRYVLILERRLAESLLLAGRTAEPQTAAAHDVLAERQRHVSGEGWTLEHDDEHGNCELVRAAAVYAINASLDEFPADDAPTLRSIMKDAMEHLWPWDASWWKPKDKRRDLVRAAALILAEIERLDRAMPVSPIEDHK